VLWPGTRPGLKTFSLVAATHAMNLADPHSHGGRGSRGGLYSRWPDPWRPEDHWGPITAAVLFLILLAGLIVYGSTHLTNTTSLTATASHGTISPL
jgi:hypothetical protein